VGEAHGSNQGELGVRLSCRSAGAEVPPTKNGATCRKCNSMSHRCSRVCWSCTAGGPRTGCDVLALLFCSTRLCCSASEWRSAYSALNASSRGCVTSSDMDIASWTASGTSDTSNVSGGGGGVGAFSTSSNLHWNSWTSPRMRWCRVRRRLGPASCLHARITFLEAQAFDPLRSYRLAEQW
jgi:hypothetical protein